ncbi:hypothetical protein BJV74DRAFT_158676 [Russula compacta]|nr:hypothetical protein BJV74DRAFT_158676 [Russula compacta]
MSTEDLDAWDATLQVCLARVLDDGADTTRVLDHLAGTIASTHIPTGASATRAAELLLSHLETPPSDAPALLGFANDTLVSTYPPEPQNKVASMWLIRTATRVVDACPVRKLREVVGALQEGLSVWVADQYRALTAEEYAFDVVPLYQTIMVCVQSLGPSIDVLKSLGPLLEAGFTGREDKPQAIVEAFRDYWDLTYAEAPVPKDGWPTPVIACLEACEIKVTAKPTPLLPEPIDVAGTEKVPVPTLAPAFTWGSSSTIVGDEDSASDATETSQDSNPFVAPTKEAEPEPPSTPKAALATIAMSSPRRPSKAATIRRADIFSPLAPAKLDFVVTSGSASSPSSSSPSRLPRTRSPLRSPKKVEGGSDKENTPPKPPSLPSLLERIAMASSGTTPTLGKRRASNALNDTRPAKKNRGAQRVAGKPNDNDDDEADDDNGRGAAATEDDSEVEREEVQQSLLRTVTPSPAAQHHLAAALTAFTTVPRAPPLPFPRSSSRSSSPTPQPASHKRKRRGVFMDAVEVPGPPAAPPRRNQPPRRCASLHMTRQRQQQQSQTTTSSTSTLEASMAAPVPVPPSPSPAVRRNLRRAKSLVDVMMNAGVPKPSPVTPARRPGKRQKVSAASVVVKKAKKAWAKSVDEVDDDSVVAAGSSSSPISASLKRAQVLFGSDDSMAAAVAADAEIDYPGGAARPSCESSDDDPHLGQVTPHHIFSPAPRRLSSRFFTVHDNA